MCGMCGERGETVQHILCECEILPDFGNYFYCKFIVTLKI